MTVLPSLQFVAIGPILLIVAGALSVLLLEVGLTRFRDRGSPRRAVSNFQIDSAVVMTAMAFLFVASFTACVAFDVGGATYFNPRRPMLVLDPLAAFMTTILAFSALLSCALAHSYLAVLGIHRGEYYALLMVSTGGMALLVSAVDLMAVFVGLEIMCLPLYALVGFDRQRLESNRSAVKYFVIGGLGSAVLLYGMALLYGDVGQTSYAALGDQLDFTRPLSLAGSGLLVAGLGLKVASVPFHQWAPDVYEGAPTPVSAFMSVGAKVAVFAVLLRWMIQVVDPAGESLRGLWTLLAAASLLVGSSMALIQTQIKRMLAFSGIAHVGYLMIGLAAGGVAGFTAVIFYLIAYTLTELGAFAVVVALAQRGRDFDSLASYSGLAKTRPGMAATMTLFMLSSAGVPGTVGFIAKFAIFAAAVEMQQIPLAVLGGLTSLVSMVYYLRVPALMYMGECSQEAPRSVISSGELMVLTVCGVGVLLFGILPNRGWLPLIGDLSVLDWARESVQVFVAP